MSVPHTTVALVLELVLVAAGLGLLWRLVLSPAARAAARTRISPLATWEGSIAEFLLFLWLVVVGGLLCTWTAQLLGPMLQLGTQTRITVTNAAFQGGMLLGVTVFHLLVRPKTPKAEVAFGASLKPGAATFLLSLPVIIIVGLAWAGVLLVCGFPIEPQDAVTILRQADSPVIIVAMIVLAVIVAPITEELIFRAGLFRYARTRLPRWAALLLPACLFAAMHNHLASFAPLTALGIIFSLAYERTGRIAVPMVAHALFNAYSVARIFIDPTAS